MTVAAYNPTYRWRFQWRDSQRDEDGNFYGHSFYLDEKSGRVAVKDMSGALPHLTDDRVLWVDKTRPMSFSMWHLNEGRARKAGYASLPVVRENGDECFVGMLWVDAITAVREYGLKVVIDKEIGELCRLATEVALLAVEKQ
jgi:hypothetical protein